MSSSKSTTKKPLSRQEALKHILANIRYYPTSGRVAPLSDKVVLCKHANPDTYPSVCGFGQTFSIHRLAWIITHGVKSLGKRDVVDHINRDKKDNRLKNLRRVTPCENMLNKNWDTYRARLWATLDYMSAKP